MGKLTSLSRAIELSATLASEMSDGERSAFFPIWDQLEEHVQLYVLNGYNELPPMKCGPEDCTMRKRRKVAITHSGGSDLN